MLFPSTSSSPSTTWHCAKTIRRFASGALPTIFALSSGQPPCAIAVIRISGDRSEQALRELIRRPAEVPIHPQRLFYTPMYDADGRLLDRGMACLLRAPRTFTGEHGAELYLHGSRAVVHAVCATLRRMPGLESARAGEFTRRAFFNGKLDAAQVEALGDLLHAETDAQLRLSHAQAKVGEYMRPTRERLVRLLARLEARIDFAEDIGDEDQTLEEEFREDIEVIGAELRRFERGARRGQLIRSGLMVALVGRPNVGKSSLLNRLAERDVAIVSNISGTTRDCLETRLQLNGQLVTMVDTAGIRDSTEDPLEREGIRRTLARASEANLVLLVLDPMEETNGPEQLESLIAESGIDPAGQQLIIVLNKSDLVSEPTRREQIENALNPDARFPLVWSCCLHENGLDSLLGMLNSQMERGMLAIGDDSDGVCLSRERHIQCLERALQHIEETKTALSQWNDPALAALMARLCADAVGEIAGQAVVQEQVLDSVFSQFCIGK